MAGIRQETSQSRTGKLLERSSHRLLGVAFLALHYSVWNLDNIAFSNTLFLIHIGLFLVWQPFINHKTQIRTRPTLILLLSIFGVIYLGGSWAQSIWLVFLIGIMSSYRLNTLADKLIYTSIIIYLLIELFGGLIPKNIRPEEALVNIIFIEYLTLALLVLIIFAPLKAGSLRNYSSDLLYSIIAVAIVVLIALTTVIWMSESQYGYYTSLIYAFMTLAGILIIFSTIFSPNVEIGLIAQFKDRYLLNLGTPFEAFLIETADIVDRTEDPDEFLKIAFTELSKLGWIKGFSWTTEHTKGSTGQTSEHRDLFKIEQVEISVYSTHELGQALRLHCKLLLRIIMIFYASKRREIALLQRAHMQAIHETGARLTHDIKNLIQSLTLMLSTANIKSPTSDELFIKNLEVITQRLQQTLVKLRNPEHVSEQKALLSGWWAALRKRLEQENILYTANITMDRQIPVEMFNNVVDNLLDNAISKRKKEPQIEIRIELESNSETLNLMVTDTGSRIPDILARSLGMNPVKSRSGFGIGLYQASRQAQAHHYALSLDCNEENDVRFCLRNQNQLLD